MHYKLKLHIGKLTISINGKLSSLQTFIFSQCPNYDKIVEVLLSDGVDGLIEKCQMIPGTPLKPMLAHPTKGIQEVLQRFDGVKFTCEFKYDGERAQVNFLLYKCNLS